MELGTLAVFLSVVREGSFSAAARTLRVAPSTVSRQIGALEERTGVRLFERTTRRMVLTDGGRLFHADISPLVEELGRAAERARDAQEVVHGTLRIATSAAFAQEHVVSWLVELRALYPELRIELVLDFRTSDLLEDRIDLAIRLGQVRASSLVALKLCAMPRVVVGGPTYLSSAGMPKHPRDLADHTCLAFPFEGFGHAWRFRDGRGRTTQLDLEPAMVIPDGVALRSLAMQGVGLTLLPRWLVAQQLHERTLVDVFPRYDVTGTVHDASVWLAFPSRKYLPLKVRVVADFIKQRFAAGPPWERLLG